MRRGLAGVGVLAGIWMVITPFVLPSQPMGQGHMMGMMHQAQASTITAESYYWHIVPGILAIILSLTALTFAGPALIRLTAAALFVVGIWSAAGPWVLPHFGLGHMMMGGVTLGSFVRHIVPGAVLVLCAIGIFGTAPGVAAAVPARETAPVH